MDALGPRVLSVVHRLHFNVPFNMDRILVISSLSRLTIWHTRFMFRLGVVDRHSSLPERALPCEWSTTDACQGSQSR